MSGGRLVVLDRAGRDVKRFPLAEGLATLGSDPACDIRIMLPTVSPHHATVVVHANQTVVRNVCEDETLVNGRCVSVAALRHGDVISIGGRHLRWEYSDPTVKRPQAPQPALYVARRAARGGGRARGRGRGRGRGRRSGPAPGGARDAALQLAIEMTHRASMPGSTGAKQVAIVQPQRRDNSDQTDKYSPKTPPQANKRPRTSKSDLDTSINEAESEKVKRKSSARVSPKTTLSNLQNTTKATLWIESRKSSPRKSNKIESPPRAPVLKLRRNTASAKKSTPLRLAVLKRAQSAQKPKVTKIQAPLKIDHTKQAAILLMTGHAAKCKQPSSADTTVTILDKTNSGGTNSSTRTSTASRRSGQRSLKKSLASTSPRKSALKDPLAKRGTRKTESIKFDLSNLETHSQDSDILMLTDTTKQSYEGDSASDDDITLRYSESSAQSPSPSPRRSIHSRSSHILDCTLGAAAARHSSVPSSPLARHSSVPSSPLARHSTGPRSPLAQPKRSARGSLMVQKVLNGTETQSYSRRTTKSISDSSKNTTVASAYRTRTLSPRTPQNDLESYSIVDLVSIDTDESARSTSVYNSAGSAGSTMFGTPQNSSKRKTRSTIDPTLLCSSTPYVKGRTSTPRSRSNPNLNTSSKTSLNDLQSTRSTMSRRSKSLSTPENTEDAKKHISVNSTRISRASRSRSRINDSDLLLLDDDDDSPKTSKRISTTSTKSTRSSVQSGSKNIDLTPVNSPAQNQGTCTPENRHSPEEASTPVLSIQSLLDSSQSSLVSQRSTRRGKPSLHAKRKTIGVITGPKTRVGAKSKSMNFSARKTRLRLSSDSVEALNKNYKQDSEIVTPKSAVKLVQEGVKNKHSTAKKPQSKRSIIDDLNESDIVKQLFNSPVKRKLSQSMTEFSRKQLFEDDDIVQVKRPTRNTTALTGRTPDDSLFDHTESYTPEIFVSPISTPRHSPNLEGIKLLFARTSPENDLRNVKGVKGLLRTPRTRRSVKNDLTNVSGVKNVFAKSPKNRLSDVRVKQVFASSPKNDLSRVSGVKTLFQSTKKRKSPRNNLDDVRGVKKLFKTRSPVNDLRNVSGVKKTLRRNSPKNDLTDVRGVKRMFRREKRNDLNDVSGVEELFNASNQSHRDADSLFDQLIGKPQIRAVYSKTFTKKSVHKTKGRETKTLHESLDVIANDVEGWLEQELNKRLHKAKEQETPSKSVDKSKGNMTRELQKLVTDTIEGYEPMRTSRIRNSTLIRSNESDRKKSASELYSAHTLPIKKRSLVTAGEVAAGVAAGGAGPRARAGVGAGAGAGAGAGLAGSGARRLPIKKRGVPHSTPVKGRGDVTMNASALGRVSPIAAPLSPHSPRLTQHYTFTTTNQPKESPVGKEPKSRRGTKAKTENVENTNAGEFVQPSPKKTRAKRKVASPKAQPVSPTKEKPVTHMNAKKTNLSDTKSPKSVKNVNPAKTKSSKPANKARAKNTKVPNPTKELPSPVPVKTTRSRRKDVSIPESNTKKRRATLLVTKKSPVMSPKPRATRKRKEPETPEAPKPSPKKTRATRKNDSVKDDKPKTPKNTRTKVQKATVIVSKPSPQLKPRATRTRGQTESEADSTRKTRKTVTVAENKPESLKKSQLQKNTISKSLAPEVQSAPKTRGKKTAANDSKRNIEEEKPLGKTRKGRKAVESVNKTTKEESIDVPKLSRTRGKKVEGQDSVESEKTTRGRRTAKPDSTTSEIKTRKRKTSAPDNDMPPKVRKSKEVAERGRKRVIETKTETRGTRKKSVVKETKAEKGQSNTPVKATRGRKVALLEPLKPAEPQQKSLRGRKANIENVSVNQETGKRKRGTATESSPVEVRSKKQRGAPPARPTRSHSQPEGKPAGRSRRR